jgi:large subunit ribosomal protein L28
MRISLHTLRSIEHNHGLDSYLLSKSNSKLTAEALRIKKAIMAAATVTPELVAEPIAAE